MCALTCISLLWQHVICIALPALYLYHTYPHVKGQCWSRVGPHVFISHSSLHLFPPQVTRTPTIEEEVPVSPSPSPFPPSPPSSPLPPPASPMPPPAMLDFEQDFGVDNMRTRMSSMSGRPIRSTGIALVIGEEESSSDSEPESSNEGEPL